MHYLGVSFSHKNTDLAIREKLAFEDQAKRRALSRLCADPAINEMMILSTCNRVEFYASTPEPEAALRQIFETIADHSGISTAELEGRADTFEDHGAVHHIFSVTSSLDSLVIGETQITGQVKEAFRFATEHGCAGRKISRLMSAAFRCAAAVRSTTDITKNPVSVASAAVVKAKDLLGSLAGRTAVVVGAGEMGSLAAKHLSTAGADLILVNRTQQRARDLASTLTTDVRIATPDDLPELINTHELLFTAVTSETPIITAAMVRTASVQRHWFDLAVPRNIDTIGRVDLSVYWVDDLREIVARNMSLREEQARAAYGIVGESTIEYFRQLETLALDPTIKALRARAESAATKELERFVKKGYIPREFEEAAMKMLHGAFNTFLHAPTVRLKEIVSHPESEGIIDALSYLFDIKEESAECDGSDQLSPKACS